MLEKPYHELPASSRPSFLGILLSRHRTAFLETAISFQAVIESLICFGKHQVALLPRFDGFAGRSGLLGSIGRIICRWVVLLWLSTKSSVTTG